MKSRIIYPPKAEDVVVRCLKRPLKDGRKTEELWDWCRKNEETTEGLVM